MKKVKLPANPVGLLVVIVVGGIVANALTSPVLQKYNQAKAKITGGGAK